MEVGGVYKGKVTKVTKMGCFVHIFNVINSSLAIVHSSHVRQEPVDDITKVIREGLFVWVKVMEVLPDRVRLSMKEGNQYNGKEFNKREGGEEVVPLRAAGGDVGALTGIKIEHEEEVDAEGQGSFNDMWEMSRLNYMGAVRRPKRQMEEDIHEVNI